MRAGKHEIEDEDHHVRKRGADVGRRPKGASGEGFRVEKERDRNDGGRDGSRGGGMRGTCGESSSRRTIIIWQSSLSKAYALRYRDVLTSDVLLERCAESTAKLSIYGPRPPNRVKAEIRVKVRVREKRRRSSWKDAHHSNHKMSPMTTTNALTSLTVFD